MQEQYVIPNDKRRRKMFAESSFGYDGYPDVDDGEPLVIEDFDALRELFEMVGTKVSRMVNACPGAITFQADGNDRWVTTAKCEHGTFVGESRSVADVEVAFAELTEKFIDAHAVKNTA